MLSQNFPWEKFHTINSFFFLFFCSLFFSVILHKFFFSLWQNKKNVFFQIKFHFRHSLWVRAKRVEASGTSTWLVSIQSDKCLVIWMFVRYYTRIAHEAEITETLPADLPSFLAKPMKENKIQVPSEMRNDSPTEPRPCRDKQKRKRTKKRSWLNHLNFTFTFASKGTRLKSKRAR